MVPAVAASSAFNHVGETLAAAPALATVQSMNLSKKQESKLVAIVSATSDRTGNIVTLATRKPRVFDPPSQLTISAAEKACVKPDQCAQAADRAFFDLAALFRSIRRSRNMSDVVEPFMNSPV